jgi:exonuclease SbcD
VVRTRAAGISQEASIASKVRAWAIATEAKAEPLLACLAALQEQTPEGIASDILTRPIAAPQTVDPIEGSDAANRSESAQADEESAELF